MAEHPKMVLCPTCRIAVADRVYYEHVKKCQAAALAKFVQHAKENDHGTT